MGVDAPATRCAAVALRTFKRLRCACAEQCAFRRPPLLGALAPAEAARSARCAAKAAELDALGAALAEAERARLSETAALEAKRAEVTAAAVALAPLAEVNQDLHMASYVQSLRQGVELHMS